MKRILFVKTIVLFSCGSIIYKSNNENKVEMIIVLNQECVKNKENVDVTFFIKNNLQTKIKIDTWHLVLDKVYTVNQEEMIPSSLIDHQAPLGVERYIIISPLSKKSIMLNTNFFEAYDLVKENTYLITGKYDSQYLNHSRKNLIYKKSVITSPISIKICD